MYLTLAYKPKVPKSLALLTLTPEKAIILIILQDPGQGETRGEQSVFSRCSTNYFRMYV